MRLFIAIPFTKKLENELLRFQKELQGNGFSGRFVPPENFHLTLAFIGEFHDPDLVLDAIESVAFKSFDIRLSGVGHFQDLYWAGIEENPMLVSYVKNLRRELAKRGIPYDRKKFLPHITLIRHAAFRDKTALAVSRPPRGIMQVDKIVLMRSDRGKHGMIYTEIGNVNACS